MASEPYRVADLCDAFWQFAKGYYQNVHVVSVVLKTLKQLCGDLLVLQFGPLKLREFQDHLVASGRVCRSGINARTKIVKFIFKWGTSWELVPVEVWQSLCTVPGLRRGRTPAIDHPPVGPVEDHVVDATLEHLGSIVADMVRFQRLTGCRPEEVCMVRPCDLDRSGDVWLYRPESHKMQHYGRERIIIVGPQAQVVLASYLLRPADAYCFSPTEAIRRWRANQRARRKTPVQPSQVNRSKPHPMLRPGERYTTYSYRQAVHRACRHAGVERWSPNRLRHLAATEIRRRYGLEGAQVILGHSRADVTQIYAERDLHLATAIMREVG